VRFEILDTISIRINQLSLCHSLRTVWDGSETMGRTSHLSQLIPSCFETVRLQIPLIRCGIHEFVPRLTANRLEDALCRIV
jgi:hypothetical protein